MEGRPSYQGDGDLFLFPYRLDGAARRRRPSAAGWLGVDTHRPRAAAAAPPPAGRFVRSIGGSSTVFVLWSARGSCVCARVCVCVCARCDNKRERTITAAGRFGMKTVCSIVAVECGERGAVGPTVGRRTWTDNIITKKNNTRII